MIYERWISLSQPATIIPRIFMVIKLGIHILYLAERTFSSKIHFRDDWDKISQDNTSLLELLFQQMTIFTYWAWHSSRKSQFASEGSIIISHLLTLCLREKTLARKVVWRLTISRESQIIASENKVNWIFLFCKLNLLLVLEWWREFSFVSCWFIEAI